jgi:hypothetical protein
MTVNAVPEKDPIALDKIFLTAKAWLGVLQVCLLRALWMEKVFYRDGDF